jgi:hypothetical protein
VQPELLVPDEDLPRSPAPRLRSDVVAAALLAGLVLVGAVVGHFQQGGPSPAPSATPTSAAPSMVSDEPVNFAYVVEGQCPTGFGPLRCSTLFDVPDRFVAAVRTLYPGLHVLWAESELLHPLQRGARTSVYYRELTGRAGSANVFARVLVAHPEDRDQTLFIRGEGDTLVEVQVRIGGRVVQVGVDTYGAVPSLARLRALAHDPRLGMR